MEDNKKIFITGVDTDIGKTFVSMGLCVALNAKSAKVGYFKPFQSGAYIEDGIKKAPDIEYIKKFVDIPMGYSYLLDGEVSPYLALKTAKLDADIDKIKSDIDSFSSNLDYTIIEGAGGLYCPACKDKLFADIIEELNVPIIIVTTPHLGRLNHTLMTIDCAFKKGIKIKGIIINKYPKNPLQSELNFIEELKDFSDVDILAKIPEIQNPDKAQIIELFKDINL